MSRLNWSRCQRNPLGYESASPNSKRGQPVPLRGGSHVKPGKVRRYTPAERRALEAERNPTKQHGNEPSTNTRRALSGPSRVAAVCEWLEDGN